MSTDHRLVGKTVERVTDRRMIGRDTYKDTVRWTETTLHFTDGTTASFSDSDGDVYDAEPMRHCETCGDPVTRLPGFGDLLDDDPATEWTHADDSDVDDEHPARPEPLTD